MSSSPARRALRLKLNVREQREKRLNPLKHALRGGDLRFDYTIPKPSQVYWWNLKAYCGLRITRGTLRIYVYADQCKVGRWCWSITSMVGQRLEIFDDKFASYREMDCVISGTAPTRGRARRAALRALARPQKWPDP